MAPSAKTVADLFLPDARRYVRHPASAQDNAALLAIWDRVSMIPHGSVSTYGAVARAAGFPGRARLAGYALRVAPKEMNLPWHRVVGAGGRIVFPKRSAPYREQSRRLRAEKISVEDGGVDPCHLID